MGNIGEPIQFMSSRTPSAEYTPMIDHDPKEYEIVRLPPDSKRKPQKWKGWILRLAPLTCSAALAFQWLYFAMRIRYAQKSKKGNDLIFMWLIISAEFLMCLPTIISYPLVKMLSGWRKEKVPLRLVADLAPRVDVIITCCGEPIDVLLDTIKATCSMDYPQAQLRIIISDDDASAELRDSVGTLMKRFPNLFYTARRIGPDHGYKAGNLNHGKEFTETLPSGNATYLASLDADMIPQPDWLRSLVPHLLLDPKVAMVCPPQLYYNIPPNDPLQQSLIPFFAFVEPIKDSLGVAWCTGSGYVIRWAALEDIGGFPTSSLAEDVFTSSLMLGMGWKTVYVKEPLQHGLIPDSLAAHVKQRTRWNVGGLQTAAALNFCLFGHKTRHMTLPQRLSGFLFPAMIISNAVITVSLIAIPLAILNDYPLIGYSSPQERLYLLQLAFLSYGSVLLNERLLSVEIGFRNALREIQGTYWLAPYLLIAIIQSFVLPKWLGGKTAVFSSSGSLAGNNERNPELRAPLGRRMLSMIIDSHLWIHIALVLANIVAVVLCLIRAFRRYETGTPEQHEYLLTHLGWPPLLPFVFSFICAGPVYYTIFPPDMPSREDMLDRDPLSGVAFPKADARKWKWDWTTVGYEWYISIAVLYAFLLWASYSRG